MLKLFVVDYERRDDRKDETIISVDHSREIIAIFSNNIPVAYFPTIVQL